jgi:hypothetical protein
MKVRLTPAAFFLALIASFMAVAPLPGAVAQMPVDEIKPGMIGTGLTVFEGTHKEEFKVQILGVLRNVIGPRRDLILARLDGGPLAETGVIAGMSGSPVYIDGRLVGAVSYSLGAFAKEPIAGITPIAEMISATAAPARRAPGQPVALRLPVTRETLAETLRATFARLRPFASRPGDVEAIGLGASAASQLGVRLMPIGTPLVFGGFDAEVRELVAGAFSEHGFVPMVGAAGGAATEAAPDRPLEPGDAVGISLVRGDLDVSGAGTVTHVDGSRVYAFGHPFFNLGPIEFAMTRATVQALLPSMLTSTKIAAIGPVVGTMQQDRATGIAGTLGAEPTMVPLTVSLASGRGPRTQFRYEVVQDQLFTPLMTYVSLISTLRSNEREFGAATFTLKARAKVKGHTDLTFEDIFTGTAPSVGLASSIAGPLGLLLGNDLEPVAIEAVDVEIASSEQPMTATLERVWVDDMRPRPGRTAQLKMVTRSYRGEEQIRAVPIEIPSNASGRLTVLVADGLRLAQLEQREQRQAQQPQSVAQMIKVLNNSRRNNRLYVKLLSGDPGVIVNGEALSSLPPSVLAVFEADRFGGSFVPLRSATIGEWELPVEHAVSGSRQLSIDVEE